MKTHYQVTSYLALVLCAAIATAVLTACNVEPHLVIDNQSTSELQNVVYSANNNSISQAIGNIPGKTTQSIQVYALDDTTVHLAFRANGQYYYTDAGYFRPSLDPSLTFTITADLAIEVEAPPDLPR